MCLVYTSMSIPYLLSAPVGGWIADATGVYWPSIVLSGDATHRSVKMRPFAPLPLTPPPPCTASSLFLGALVFLFFLRKPEEPPPSRLATTATNFVAQV